MSTFHASQVTAALRSFAIIIQQYGCNHVLIVVTAVTRHLTQTDSALSCTYLVMCHASSQPNLYKDRVLPASINTLNKSLTVKNANHFQVLLHLNFASSLMSTALTSF